jgi:hypothetical protein
LIVQIENVEVEIGASSNSELLTTMPVELREIQIASEYDHDGRLILVDGSLVAVLVKLSELHEHLAGQWYLETGYGVLKNEQPTFLDLDSAVEWIQGRLKHAPTTGKIEPSNYRT